MVQVNIAVIKKIICLAFLKIIFIITLSSAYDPKYGSKYGSKYGLRNGNKLAKEKLLQVSKYFQNSLQWMENLQKAVRLEGFFSLS